MSFFSFSENFARDLEMFARWVVPLPGPVHPGGAWWVCGAGLRHCSCHFAEPPRGPAVLQGHSVCLHHASSGLLCVFSIFPSVFSLQNSSSLVLGQEGWVRPPAVGVGVHLSVGGPWGRSQGEGPGGAAGGRQRECKECHSWPTHLSGGSRPRSAAAAAGDSGWPPQ